MPLASSEAGSRRTGGFVSQSISSDPVHLAYWQDWAGSRQLELSCSSNPFPMNSSTSFPREWDLGRKLHLMSDHGTQVLPRPLEFRLGSLPCGISIPLNGSCNGYAY